MDKPRETTQPQRNHSNCGQFWVLLWKNWLLQKKIATRTILIALCLLTGILVMVRDTSTLRFITNATTYDSFIVTTNISHYLQEYPPEQVFLTYAPNTTLVARIVNRATSLMGVKISPDLGFATESELVDRVTANEDIFGALVFDVSKDSVNLPKKISYKIRLRSDKWFSFLHRRIDADWKREAMFSDQFPMEARNDGGPWYYYEGFLAIQMAVDLSLIAEVNKSFDPTSMNVTTLLKQYPYPPYNSDPMIGVIRHVLPLFVLLSFIIIAPTICQQIVLEKENKFKELMKLMGMRTWLYWSSWFVKYMLFMLASVIIMTIILHAPFTRYGPVIAKSSATVTFVFLLLYTLSIITVCFSISTLASNAYAPFFYLGRIYDDMTLVQKVVASLDFNLAMAFGCIKISQYEALGSLR